MNIWELRREKKLFYSDCCKDKFTSPSNGLCTYYVCQRCYKKTTPINGKGKQLGRYGEIINKLKNTTNDKKRKTKGKNKSNRKKDNPSGKRSTRTLVRKPITM